MQRQSAATTDLEARGGNDYEYAENGQAVQGEHEHEAVPQGLHAVHKRRNHNGGDTAELPCPVRRERGGSGVGWTDKQLEEISCEVEELDVINDLYEVTGISMDDVSGEEIPCKKAPIGFTYAGMRLLVLRDERGGIAGINERQLEPIMDELKNGQYMVWYRRTMSNGNPYYVLKCGMYLRMAVLPIVFDDVFAAALDEIRAGLATAAAIRQQMHREGEENDG